MQCYATTNIVDFLRFFLFLIILWVWSTTNTMFHAHFHIGHTYTPANYQ